MHIGLLKVEDVSEENLEDIFKICSRAFEIPPHNKFDHLLYEKGMEVRRRWLIDALRKRGPCAKIAYLDGRPRAQIVFCPEEMMPHIRDPRGDVISILCMYNPFPEAQRKGVATALVEDLLGECDSGLSCLGGPCRFLVTAPFPPDGPTLTEFYKKHGFRRGRGEMYREVRGKYLPREAPEYTPRPEDLEKTVILYNPACEWGYFYAFKVVDLIKERDPDHPVEIFDIWERPEEYMRRTLHRVTAGRAIVKGRVMRGGIFWTDREAFIRELERALR